MAWRNHPLRPHGVPKNGKCPVCNEPLKRGNIPIDKAGLILHMFVYCWSCRAAWSLIDTNTDYRLYKIDGKLRATPR